MCIGGGPPRPEVPKPAPAPPVAPPAPPPKEAPAPRKAIESPNNAPSLVLGSKKKKTKNRSSITSAAGRTGAPNTGSPSGTLNI